jgi:alkylation response protein AidB-like acyl-CoA dehydrogenase
VRAGLPAAEKATEGGRWREDARLRAAVAKTTATETAVGRCDAGPQFRGGRSGLTDRRIPRVYRDARTPVIYGSANEI